VKKSNIRSGGKSQMLIEERLTEKGRGLGRMTQIRHASRGFPSPKPVHGPGTDSLVWLSGWLANSWRFSR
jgi:hypothetical protein